MYYACCRFIAKHDEGLSALRKRLKCGKEKYVSTDTIIDLAQVVLKNNLHLDLHLGKRNLSKNGGLLLALNLHLILISHSHLFISFSKIMQNFKIYIYIHTDTQAHTCMHMHTYVCMQYVHMRVYIPSGTKKTYPKLIE